MADDSRTGDGNAQAGEGKFDLVVGKSTDKFYAWQQIPAWVLGGAAIIGGAILIAFPKHQTPNAWAAIIIGLFLAGLLSYRSAFTLNDGSSAGPADPAPTTKQDDARNGAAAGPKGPAATAKPPGDATKPSEDADSTSGAGSGDPARVTKPNRVAGDGEPSAGDDAPGAGDDGPTPPTSTTPDAEPGATS